MKYKLIFSVRLCVDLSIRFDSDRVRRQRELTNNKKQKEKCHVRNILRVTFTFAEQQKKGIYGLGYELPLTRNDDNSVLNKNNAANNGKIKNNCIEWYVPHYTLCMEQRKIKY